MMFRRNSFIVINISIIIVNSAVFRCADEMKR